jgi:hypothetical protein
MLFPTTLVGSYPEPEWLSIARSWRGASRQGVHAKELWRIPEAFLEEPQNDPTILAIKAQEEAGLDIITDGEIRRESYSNRFVTAVEGVDIDILGTALDRSGHATSVRRSSVGSDGSGRPEASQAPCEAHGQDDRPRTLRGAALHRQGERDPRARLRDEVPPCGTPQGHPMSLSARAGSCRTPPRLPKSNRRRERRSDLRPASLHLRTTSLVRGRM